MPALKKNAIQITNEVDNFPETRKALNILGNELVIEIQTLLLKYNKVATGDLVHSIGYQIRTIDDTLQLEIKEKNTDKPYLVYVNNGRKPGRFPPIKAIRKWIDDKPIKIIKDSKTNKIPTKDQVAFLIARHIAENGIKPTHVIEEAMRNIYQNRKSIIVQAVNKDVRNEMKFIISDMIQNAKKK